MGRSGDLAARVVPVASLDADARASMWTLFAGHYEGASRATFDADLAEKQDAILARDTGEFPPTGPRSRPRRANHRWRREPDARDARPAPLHEADAMRLTVIHPCIGRKVGQRYIRTWQMEPLPPATLAALTPKDIEVKFYDDRMEAIPFDEPTDLVAMSVETYTARRAYQIASEYRARGVPVVMGGFHATLRTEEVQRFAESVVVGEAEEVWPRVLRDFRAGSMERVYRATKRPDLRGVRPDRSIFAGKRYLPTGLVEAGRGCHLKCDFCAIQAFFSSTQTRRPAEDIIAEIRELKATKKLFFFVDDNITSNMAQAKEFFRALIPEKIKWVSQASMNAAHDEEFLALIKKSGCQGLLIGFESLDPENLKDMNKGFNTMKGGFEVALANLRKHGIRLYPTFIFGYDHDTPASFDATQAFAQKHAFYIAAFNHLTPFPGTPLYKRLEKDGRLRYREWWLDPAYRYNTVPFSPRKMTPEEVQAGCVEARARFYSWKSILKRSLDAVNRQKGMFLPFFNHQRDVPRRSPRARRLPAWRRSVGRRAPRSEGCQRAAAAAFAVTALKAKTPC